jgi:hypothetical protein
LAYEATIIAGFCKAVGIEFIEGVSEETMFYDI